MPDNAPATVAVPKLMQARDAAAILSISERSLWTLAQAGRIRCVRLGTKKRGLVRFALEDLQDFISRSKTGGTP